MNAADQKTYYDLKIVAEAPDTKIWLGDDEGHFVVSGIGTLSAGLLPGTYTAEFGLGKPQYEIALSADSLYTEKDLTANRPTPRRIPEISEE